MTPRRICGFALMSVVLAVAGCGAPQPDQPPTANLTCTLPVGSYPAGYGGFIKFPAGTFVPDPRSGSTYEVAASRWLSVPSAYVSPDGTAYAGAELNKVPINTTAIRIIGVTTDEATTSWTVGGGVGIIGWTRDGIYFVREASQDPNFVGPELWILNPATGTTRLVTPQPRLGAGLPLFKAWTAFGGGAVWSKTVPDTGPARDIIERIDPSSGQAVTWLTSTGSELDILGWDEQGNAFVAIGGAHSIQLVRLIGANKTSPIQSQGFAAPATAPPSVVTDAHGSWFVDHRGVIWLLPTGRAQLVRVASVPLPTPTPPQTDMGFQIVKLHLAGPCI